MGLIQEVDYGTPIRQSERLVTLTIDGQSVSVPAGTSVMAAAMSLGTKIPKLCATDSLEPFGSCRLCLVEIKGRRGTPASCTTPAEEGMVVQTQSSKLAKLRKGVMELYISDHPLDCLTCSANGDCELQDMAGAVGLREVRYAPGADHFHAEKHGHDNPLFLEKDSTNPYFSYDPSKCIVCNRCVRACEEVQGTFALTITGRGFDSRVSAGGLDFLASDCVSCGACVQACPTATLMEKSVIEHGTPEHSKVTTCAYCGVGCSFKAEMQGDKLVRMVPYKDGRANEGHSCVKGRFAYGYATHKDRITKPMIRSKITDPWQEVSWEVAINHAASEFRRIQAAHGRESIGAITSSRCTNEEVFLVQKLVRAAMHNNNVDTCARVCHSPTGYGLKTTLGTSAGTQDFKSVAKADVILVIGANPTDGHPVFASRMKKRLRQGAKLIVADPRKIDLVKSPHIKAQHHLPLKPGTNVALINAFAHVVVTEGLVNEEYVRGRCDLAAFESWARFVALPHNSPEASEAHTGVSASEVRAMGYEMNYAGPSEIMDEIARLTPSFKGVSYAMLDAAGSVQWPCNDQAPEGTPIMHVDRFVRGKGMFMITEYVPTEERTGPRFPLILTTGRILSQYNVGAQTRRTENSTWHAEDVLEIHPFDAESRGISDGELVSLSSRSGDIALRVEISERMQPGVVYTTFHHAVTGANVITTEFSDWATNCPEYKVTAVEVRRTNQYSAWQERNRAEDVSMRRIAAAPVHAAE